MRVVRYALARKPHSLHLDVKSAVGALKNGFCDERLSVGSGAADIGWVDRLEGLRWWLVGAWVRVDGLGELGNCGETRRRG